MNVDNIMNKKMTRKTFVLGFFSIILGILIVPKAINQFMEDQKNEDKQIQLLKKHIRIID